MGHNNSVNKAWKGLWMTIVREIWNLRNKVVFRGGLVDEEEIFLFNSIKGLTMI